MVAVNHAQGNQVSLRWLLYDGHGNLVRTMSPDYPLSGWQFRGVWGELQGVLGVGRGYCANLGHPEDETGLVSMRARYYEPATGRFLSEDPARDGVNWYLYADGNPIVLVDSTGRFADFMSVLTSLLETATLEGRSAATAQAVAHYGKQRILDAISEHIGYITGYLLGMEIEQYGYTKVGLFFRVTDPITGGMRQIHIDFVDQHSLGGPHIEFQGVGHSRARRFLEGLGAGLRDALGWR
ncbi:tRNA(Glu)-specific nuclease WapA [bacterium HR15]|nr:tRNA(Glu)-specific nuclease WapA [bacterium HR15]